MGGAIVGVVVEVGESSCPLNEEATCCICWIPREIGLDDNETLKSLSSTAILLILPAFLSPPSVPLEAPLFVVLPTDVSSLKLQAGKIRGDEGRANETRLSAFEDREMGAVMRGVDGDEDDDGVVVAVVVEAAST